MATLRLVWFNIQIIDDTQPSEEQIFTNSTLLPAQLFNTMIKQVYTSLLALVLFASGSQTFAQSKNRTPERIKTETNWSIMPQAAPSQVQQVISRYTRSKDYDWNDTTQTWTYAEEGRYRYDSQGNLVRRYFLAPTTLDTLGRYDYSYNAQNKQVWRGAYSFDPNSRTWIYGSYDSTYYDSRGNSIHEVTRYYDQNSSAWVNSLRVLTSYDNYGNRLQTTTESWDANAVAWTPITGRKSDYTYTPSGHIETVTIYNFNSSTGQFDLRERDTITVNAQGVPQSYYAYIMTGNGWALRMKYDSVSWYEYTSPLIATSKPARYIIKGRSLGNWADSIRSTTRYQANGSYQILTEARNLVGWAPRNRQTVDYDNNGLYTGLTLELYLQNNWRTLVGIRRTPTYAANNLDLLELVTTSYSSTTSAYENTTKSEYFDHFQLTGLGSNKQAQTLKLSPNPATGWVTIKTVPGVDGNVQLFNSLGQMVKQQAINGEASQVLELDGLHAGIYHVVVNQRGQESKAAKLVVR